MNTLTLTKQKKKTKTYLYLKQALIILLQKNKYGDITVKDLVEKAGISRTAFYAQFKSKQDLVDQLINDIHSDATNIATENNNMCFFSEKNFVSYYIRLYNYILQNSDIYKVMLNNNGLAAFRTRMTQEALNLWKSKSCMFKSLNTVNKPDLEIMLYYIISAHIGIIEYWLNNNMKESPEYMANQLYQMTWQIISSKKVALSLNINA